ncbi:MAG: MBL fold metallo-hydrolase [Minisyncoccia bacterium]|jgi:beta-lactamase superfamily II metal-dependent hydrolase
MLREYIRNLIENNFKKAVFWLTLFFVLDIIVFRQIAGGVAVKDKLALYFLPVGQGDSELAVLPGGVKILIDGGPPDSLVLANLDKVLSPRDRYIDLVISTHPQQDHFGGLIEVLRRYKVGTFVWNGEVGTNPAMNDLLALIKENNVPMVTLVAGDKIIYGESETDVLSPVSGVKVDINEDALVLALQSGDTKTLFTSDVGAKTETSILNSYAGPIDILKVGHHGSKFSSSANFLNILRPKVAVIEVGKNSYGHPTPEVLNRLADIGAQIFRTDQDGLIKFEPAGGALKIFKVL